MKMFAFYLPQYHEIKENNEWWGKGFTEWTHVKNAKPLFKGHNQPQIPLNNNYYNLMDKKTIKWQTGLAKKYGIDGFAYYHYYFNGKKLLEKPAENFLKWKDINHSFFFCWANHNWYKAKDGNKELLLEQNYGSRKDWEYHFEYLLPFFKDERYEKINNCPVLMIYRPLFNERDDMVACFDRLCKKEGFNGIFIVDNVVNYNELNTILENCRDDDNEKVLQLQPAFSKNIYHPSIKRRIGHYISYKKNKIRTYKAAELYDSYYVHDNDTRKFIDTIVIEFDNSPRHQNLGYIIQPANKKQFFSHMDKLNRSSGYLMINAWNEWAEKMILEPSYEHGFKYLEWIKEWKSSVDK